MLGRAATRIELKNRDSDMEELELVRKQRMARHVQAHQASFATGMGGRPNGTLLHSIFTNDSSSSGIGGGSNSMLAVPNFQAHNMGEGHDSHQGLTSNSRMTNNNEAGLQHDNSLQIYGSEPFGRPYSNTPAARPSHQGLQPQAYIPGPGPHSQTHLAQAPQQPTFYPPQQHMGGSDSSML